MPVDRKLLVSAAGKLKINEAGQLADPACCCGSFPPFLLYQYEVTNGSLAWFTAIFSQGEPDYGYCTWQEHHIVGCPGPSDGSNANHYSNQTDCKRRFKTERVHVSYFKSDNSGSETTYNLVCDETVGGDVNHGRFRRYVNFDITCQHGVLNDCIVQDFNVVYLPGICQGDWDCVTYEETVSNEYMDGEFVAERDAWVDLSLLDGAAAINSGKWAFQEEASSGNLPAVMIANNYHLFRGRYTSREDGIWRILFPAVDYIKLWIRTFTRTYTLTDDGIGNGAGPCVACGSVGYSSDCTFVDSVIETGRAQAPSVPGSGAYMAEHYGFGDPAGTPPDWHWLPLQTAIAPGLNEETYVQLLKYSVKRGETPPDPPAGGFNPSDCPGAPGIPEYF